MGDKTLGSNDKTIDQVERNISIYWKNNLIDCSVTALGMEHGHIKDVDITASSTFDHHSVGPHIGRWSELFKLFP